jgi:hypothetical protein
MIDPDKAQKQREVLARRRDRYRQSLRKGGRSAGKVEVRLAPLAPLSIDLIAWSSPGGRGCA